MSNPQGQPPISGLAITSLILGILALLGFWIPVLPVFPAVLSVVLGLIALRATRRGTASGQGLAVAGMICSVLGLIPTVILIGGLLGLVSSVREMGPGDLEALKQFDAARPQASATEPTITLTIGTNAFFAPKEAYKIKQEREGLGDDVESGYSGVEALDFHLKSSAVNYKGKLEIVEPRKLKITMNLEASKPVRLQIKGLSNVSVKEGDAAVDSSKAIPSGTHVLTITGASE